MAAASLMVAVGDLHTAGSFPDSLVQEQQSGPALVASLAAVNSPAAQVPGGSVYAAVASSGIA